MAAQICSISDGFRESKALKFKGKASLNLYIRRLSCLNIVYEEKSPNELTNKNSASAMQYISKAMVRFLG